MIGHLVLSIRIWELSWHSLKTCLEVGSSERKTIRGKLEFSQAADVWAGHLATGQRKRAWNRKMARVVVHSFESLISQNMQMLSVWRPRKERWRMRFGPARWRGDLAFGGKYEFSWLTNIWVCHRVTRRAWDHEITRGGIAPTRLFHSIHVSKKYEFSRLNCGFTAQDLSFGRNFLRRSNQW